MYYRVLVASQSFHGQESLTYLSDSELVVGQVVAVPLQNRTSLGIVESKVATKPSFATKKISSQWPTIVPKTSLALLEWLSQYYPAPLGLITELFTPPALPKKLPAEVIAPQPSTQPELPELTQEQTKVLKTIQHSSEFSFLLHGDTGTGKTRVYLELARQSLESGRSVIILTPEIGLTAPLFETFTKVFGDLVVITHSDMTPAQRRSVWLRASTTKTGLVIIGPRSALFSPLRSIGLIVMDEAHDTAYKQEQAPRYQTSRVAAQLARLHKAQFIMGSATPLVVDYFAFSQKKLPILRMTELAVSGGWPSAVVFVDHRQREHFDKSPWISTPLLKAIATALQNKEQSLLFLNRRGSARLVLCESCGWQAMCPHCDVALTYHQDLHIMRCHSCDFTDSVPSICPTCRRPELIFRSIGTKALESEIRKLFPEARVSRFDRDTLKPERLSQQHTALQSGAVDVLIGTQSIVKGFDLPKLSVVGVIQADSGLQIPDFTASERTFQLLSQVSGRIGRGHRTGALFVQTYRPDSSLLTLALDKNYDNFYQQELKQRQSYKFPPFIFMLKITCARASSESARNACQKLADELKRSLRGVIVEGPSPRFVERVSGQYAWHIILKSPNRSNLVSVVQKLKGNFTSDLDPSNLL